MIDTLRPFSSIDELIFEQAELVSVSVEGKISQKLS